MKSYAHAPSGLSRTRAASERATRAAGGSLRRALRLPVSVLLGRLLLGLLFVVIPVFNPALYKAGDERLYLGTVVVLAVAAVMLPSLRLTRFRWIVIGLAVALLYVLETGILRGDLAVGIVGNSYRPIHAVLVFSACAVFLLASNRERWLRLFVAGGLVGCALAVVNTLVPAIDPFALSRPDDLGWYGDAKFITSQRQAGAFIYPGNFGPYAAYVAIAALIALERKRLRLFSVNLYSLAVVSGVLGIVVSGSRAAALGVIVAAVVVMWRSPPFRLPLLVTGLVGMALLAVVAWVTGVLEEIIQSRVGQADLSLALRFESWRAAWEAFVDNPLFGGGVIPNTIDSTLFYYLGVGGLVGLGLVLAMYWFTLLRPLRRGDWSALPIVLAVLAIGITQDSFGQPLATWAFAAAIFLVSSPDQEDAFHGEASAATRHRRGADRDLPVTPGAR
jgi:hypothetical protein